MKKKMNIGNETNKKFRLFIYFIAFLILIYIGRLVFLQVFDANSYRVKAEREIIRKETIYPERGAIYDRNNKPLAINMQFNTAYVTKAITPSERARLQSELDALDKKDFSNTEKIEEYEIKLGMPDYTYSQVEQAAKILEVNTNDILRLLESGIAGPIADKVSNEKKESLKAQSIPFISFYGNNERYYPNMNLLSNTLGFVENNRGQNGLERYYDEILAGKKGYQEFYKSIGGTILPFESNQNINENEALSIVTSLDEDIQEVVHNNLLKFFKDQNLLYATAIVTNPNTGEVVAMESLPNYDPNAPRDLSGELDLIFLDKLAEEDRDEYMQSRWTNNNVSSVYEPGSSFKGITTAIGLESNSEIINETYFCEGTIEIYPGIRIRCWRYYDPHGAQSLQEAFKNSCNPAYVQIIDMIGKENFVEGARAFKYGELTGIDLPNEVKGVFPTDSNLSNVDFRPMAYGHSLSTTPIQQISALNATINGGTYYRPHILKEIINKDGDVLFEQEAVAVSNPISEKTSKEMRSMFEFVSSDRKVYDESEYRIGSKTGTTEIQNPRNLFSETDKEVATIVSIYGFYPVDSPKYSILMIGAEPQNGSMGSMLNNVLVNTIEEIEKISISEENIENSNKNLKMVPNLTGMSVTQAQRAIQDSKLVLSIEEQYAEYSVIASQSPEANSNMQEGSTVKATIKQGAYKLPNLVGQDIADTESLLNELNLKYKVEGVGQTVKSVNFDYETEIDSNFEIIINTQQ